MASWFQYFQRCSWLRVALLLVLLSGCAPARTPSGNAATLNVFAAASLTGAFNELGQAFTARNPGITVAFNFAGSQQLANQIREGAPADVFASANQSLMDAAVQAGEIDAASVKPFAGNRLVLVVPIDNPANLTALQDLARGGLRLVFAAKEVPVGQYTLEFLNKAAQDPAFGPDYPEKVQKNVVSYEDNVKAVLNKVSLAEADAGIVYASDLTGDARGRVKLIDIPDPLNVAAVYSIAMLKDSPHPQAAHAFIDFVLSQEGQAVLAKYGFIPTR